MAQSHPSEEVALYGQHPDHGLPVPDGPLFDAGRAGEVLPEDDEMMGESAANRVCGTLSTCQKTYPKAGK